MINMKLCLTALALLANFNLALGAKRTCLGDINDLKPTGMGGGLGTDSSYKNAANDLKYLNRQKSCYQSAADKNCIQASVIAAIASRESRGGYVLESTGGYGDGGYGWGIMQCDLQTSGLDCKKCGWDSCCHIEMMVKDLLVPYIKQVQQNHRDWLPEQALQGGVSAYNAGVGNVVTWSRLDVGTTYNDYSNDVMARAQWIYDQGWN